MAKKLRYDVAIIGSGPGGLGVAYGLTDPRFSDGKKRKIVIIETETKVAKGGLTNDCKLNLTHKIGMDLDELKISEEEAQGLIDYVEGKFIQFVPDAPRSGEPSEETRKLEEIADKYNIEYVNCIQRHFGTDRSKHLTNGFREELEWMGVEFLMGARVNNITKKKLFWLDTQNGEDSYEIAADQLIVSPGRDGAYWLRDQAEALGVKYIWGPIDVGIRVEVLAEAMAPITDINYDPKFKYKTRHHMDPVRTFCTNPGGRVRRELKGDKGFYLINGDATSKHKTKNTNFAVLQTVRMTQPNEDTTELGRGIARQVNELWGGGKPLVQRVGDLMNGKRSKPETFSRYDHILTPSVPKGSVTPGDITYAYPSRVIRNITEFLQQLDKMVRDFAARGNVKTTHGILERHNCVYAPEIKFYDTKYPTDEYMQTNVNGLYVAGDGCGKSRGIVGAFISGILAAKGVMK